MSVHRQSSGWLTPAAPAAKQSELTNDMSAATPEGCIITKNLPTTDYFGTVGHGLRRLTRHPGALGTPRWHREPVAGRSR